MAGASGRVAGVGFGGAGLGPTSGGGVVDFGPTSTSSCEQDGQTFVPRG
jgi:hypothetical protein